jgi:DNA-sulfur modification-associated
MMHRGRGHNQSSALVKDDIALNVEVPGFISESKITPMGSIYQGRLALPGVQWTGVGRDIFATVTVTVEQIADAAESRLLWTDQSVQRGIKPTAPSGIPRELAVSDGYPDSRYYIFDGANADDMVNKLLRGERLFLNPLVWNLRPSHFEAFWHEITNELFIYSGKIYLPDSHHRHQAILKAVRAYRESPGSYPNFSLSRQFKIELYFLDRENEGNYFFDKNQRPKPTALSKAYDLTTEDDLSTLAKRVLDHSPELNAGVNRATDRLSKKAPQFMTLSTLRELMRTFAGSDEVEETELEGLAVTASEFLDLLARIRPELNADTAQAVREETLASAAVIMHGYATLMKDYNNDLAKFGRDRARNRWAKQLAMLSPDQTYHGAHGFEGDYLSKQNPLWQDLGITRYDPDRRRITVANTGGARARAGRELRRYLRTHNDDSDE